MVAGEGPAVAGGSQRHDACGSRCVTFLQRSDRGCRPSRINSRDAVSRGSLCRVAPGAADLGQALHAEVVLVREPLEEGPLRGGVFGLEGGHQ